MNDVEPSLVDKVIILDDTLSAHGITHAFGGALAHWVDIESMRQAGAIDVAAVAEVVRSLVGDDDRVSRLLAFP